MYLCYQFPLEFGHLSHCNSLLCYPFPIVFLYGILLSCFMLSIRCNRNGIANKRIFTFGKSLSSSYTLQIGLRNQTKISKRIIGSFAILLNMNAPYQTPTMNTMTQNIRSLPRTHFT